MIYISTFLVHIVIFTAIVNSFDNNLLFENVDNQLVLEYEATQRVFQLPQNIKHNNYRVTQQNYLKQLQKQGFFDQKLQTKNMKTNEIDDIDGLREARVVRLKHIFHHSRRPSDDDTEYALPRNTKDYSSQTAFLQADINQQHPSQSPDKDEIERYKFYQKQYTVNSYAGYEMDVDSSGKRQFNRLPDPFDLETVISLSEMCLDAYIDRSSPSWTPVKGYPSNISTGWDSDGLRGYVFGSDDLLIIAIKGTSTAFFGVGGGPTSKRDKLEDNMMFSCCCASVDRTWWPVCGCANGKVCELQCMREAANYPDSYINIAKKIYEQVQLLYPGTPVWFTGHSLGASVSALAASQIKTTSAFGFEAPGDRLFFEKMGWNINNEDDSPSKLSSLEISKRRIWHYGVSSDPIFMGECNGVASACYIAGYAMESRCHLGHTCYLDYPAHEQPNSTDIRTHKMVFVHEYLKTKSETFDPHCYYEPPCSECVDWVWDT